MNKRITDYLGMENDLEHQDSVWYRDEVCHFTVDKRFSVVVKAIGDISIVDTKTGDSTSNPEDWNIQNDEQLKKALEKGEIEWVNNNWFEFSIVDKKTKEYITEESDDLILDNLNQALDTKYAVEYIDNYLKEEKENSSKTR